MKRNKLIFVIGGPLTISRTVHLRKLMDILKWSFSDVVIIHEGAKAFSNRESTFSTGLPLPKQTSWIILRILNYWIQELKKVKLILRQTAPGDVVLFSGIYQPLSLVITKIRGGYPVQFCGGFDAIRASGKSKLLEDIYLIMRWTLQLALLRLSRRLVFETPSVKSFYNMDKFRTEVSCYGPLYVEESFSFVTPLMAREIDLGYVGVLSREKGIIELLESLPIIMDNRRINVILIGDGYLKPYVQRYLAEHRLQDSVKLVSQVGHKNMPEWLNNIKLLVAPSLSEGLHGVLIEAMACGTPVLTTKVGGITDVIKDGSTGFLLDSVEPKHIAQQILRLLDHTDLLVETSIQAQKVRTIFSLPAVRKSWQRILEDILEDQTGRKLQC